MGRGLSDLQKRILDALKDGKQIDRHNFSSLVYGKTPTKVMIVSLSRAILRLHARGLIDLFGSGFHLEPGHSMGGGFHRDPLAWPIRDIQITVRGSALLRGEELPPLKTVFTHLPGRCWCGADLHENSPNTKLHGYLKIYDHHQLLPEGWTEEEANG